VIVALLNQKGGVGKTTLALHLAGAWAERGRRTLVVDADPQGSALDWSEQRSREGLARAFGVLGLARETLHRELPEIAVGYDRVVIDGPPRVAGIARSALLAADLILIPATPSRSTAGRWPRCCGCSMRPRIFRPRSPLACYSIAAPRTVIARETAAALADHDPPVLASRVRQRITFADTARTGRLIHQVPAGLIAAQEVAAVAAEIDGLAL